MAAARPVMFADLLRRLRRAAGLSQEELADRAGLSRNGVSELERGLKRAPHKDTIARLAAALELADPERMAFEDVARGRALVNSRPRQAPTARRAERIAFVGREREMAHLQRFLACESTPLLLLGGEPGIGKSRLLREAAERARAAGWSVLEGGCQWRGGQPPFAPFLEALARHVMSRPPAHLRRDLEGASWLVRLLPELAETAPVPAPRWALPPEQERRLMFAAVARYLANIGGPAGTLLVLDDLQWANSDALDLLGSLVSDAPVASDAPLLLLGAYRSTEVHVDHPLSHLLADLSRDGLAGEMPLGPLASEEARDLLVRLLAGSEDRAALIDQLLERASGMPFYLISCARAAQSEAQLGVTVRQWDTAVPWDVAQSIRQRIALLPAGSADLLGAAAVVGRQVERTVLEALALWLGLEPGVVAASLTAALRARLLVEEGDADYCFAHDLIREVAAADLGAWRRSAAHRVIAEAMEARLATKELDQRSAELAVHFARCGEPSRALHYFERAGDQAFASRANSAAEGFFRDALAQAELQGHALAAARVSEKLATILSIRAEYDLTLELCDRVAAAYHALGDSEGVWRALELYAEICGARGTPHQGVERLEPFLESLAASAPSVGTARVYRVLVFLYRRVGQINMALAMSERAVEAARCVGAADVLVRAQHQRGTTLTWMKGRRAEGDRVLEENIPLAEAVGDLLYLSSELATRADTYFLRGDFTQAGHWLARSMEVAERLGDPTCISSVTASRGYLDFCQGDWARARDEFHHAAFLSPVGSSLYSAQHQVLWAQLCMAEGHWDEAASHIATLDDLTARGVESHLWRTVHAIMAERDLLAGRSETSLPRLQQLQASAREWAPPDSGLLMQAWLRLELGELAQAEAEVLTIIACCRSEPNSPMLLDALRIQALLDTRRGRWEAGAAALDEALALARPMPHPYAEAKALYVYGMLEAARGDPGRARKRYEQARAICEQLGEGLYHPCIERGLAAL